MAKHGVHNNFFERARTAKKKAVTALDRNRSPGGKPLTSKEKTRHQRAIAAANRVLARTGKQKSVPVKARKAPSSRDVTKPGKPKSTDLFAGIKALFTMGNVVRKLPGKERKNLKGIEEQMRR